MRFSSLLSIEFSVARRVEFFFFFSQQVKIGPRFALHPRSLFSFTRRDSNTGWSISHWRLSLKLERKRAVMRYNYKAKINSISKRVHGLSVTKFKIFERNVNPTGAENSVAGRATRYSGHRYIYMYVRSSNKEDWCHDPLFSDSTRSVPSHPLYLCWTLANVTIFR